MEYYGQGQHLYVHIYGATDSILAGLLPALPNRWTYAVIAGEQRPTRWLINVAATRGIGQTQSNCHTGLMSRS